MSDGSPRGTASCGPGQVHLLWIAGLGCAIRGGLWRPVRPLPRPLPGPSPGPSPHTLRAERGELRSGSTCCRCMPREPPLPGPLPRFAGERENSDPLRHLPRRRNDRALARGSGRVGRRAMYDRALGGVVNSPIQSPIGTAGVHPARRLLKGPRRRVGRREHGRLHLDEERRYVDKRDTGGMGWGTGEIECGAEAGAPGRAEAVRQPVLPLR